MEVPLRVPAKLQHPIRWLEACVCTLSFYIAFNGSAYGFFKRKRGLRQGNPLSPYLFVLVMNCLSMVLQRAAASGQFHYHPRCGKTKLTHLSFADHLLTFSHGSLSLSLFCSGHSKCVEGFRVEIGPDYQYSKKFFLRDWDV